MTRFLLLTLALPVLAAVTPATLPRAEICLNGPWQADSATRRVPEMPIATKPPTSSVTYHRSVRIPADWIAPNRRFVLYFDKVGHYAAVSWDGVKLGEHYGQFTPFEFELPSDLKAGDHQLTVEVRSALGKYIRQGADFDDPLIGNAYRGATDKIEERNWIGIVGDVYLKWRPSEHIDDVFITPSVRHHKLESKITLAGSDGAGFTIRASVLDAGKQVLAIPAQPAGASVTLTADWRDPILWGPPPYGQAKLYTLRTELLKNGKVVDRQFTRFGFREVWIEGRDVLLNGKKLWMAGTYFGKLVPIRYINERHQQAEMLAIMQASGLNTLHSHWDEAGQPWLDRCDEMGMLVLGAFVCDGRPLIESKADPGWLDWMAATGRQWVRANRNHPSIVMWRPIDVVPNGVPGAREAVWPRLAEVVKQTDGTRPVADGSDIAAWAQNAFADQPGQAPESGVRGHTYDDGSRMAKELAASTKPFLTKELYVGFSPVPQMTKFFADFYQKAFTGGGTGIIVQHMPLTDGGPPQLMTWLSESGEGNRPPVFHSPAGTPTPFSKLFAQLYTEYTKQPAKPWGAAQAPELLVSKLAPGDVALLVPADPAIDEAVGVVADAVGTAWLYAPAAGDYTLLAGAHSSTVRLSSGTVERRDAGR